MPVSMPLLQCMSTLARAAQHCNFAEVPTGKVLMQAFWNREQCFIPKIE